MQTRIARDQVSEACLANETAGKGFEDSIIHNVFIGHFGIAKVETKPSDHTIFIAKDVNESDAWIERIGYQSFGRRAQLRSPVQTSSNFVKMAAHDNAVAVLIE